MKKNNKHSSHKFNIRKGDTVVVIAGNYKGTQGEVKEIITTKDRLIVDKVNIVKRHTKPSAQSPNGGIVEKENSIHISNVALLDSTTKKPSRVGKRLDKKTNKYVRYLKKSDEII